MAEFQHYLERLDADPRDKQALAALETAVATNGSVLDTPDTLGIFSRVRSSLRERGELEVAAKLVDVELSAVKDRDRQADLWLEKGDLYANDLLEDEPAVACFREVLKIRPDDETASETLTHIDMERANWEKFVKKNLDEAEQSTNRGLTTHMYLAAAKLYGRYKPESNEVEVYLRKALDADPKNRQAAVQLRRLFERQERWQDLAALYSELADVASGKEGRVQALLGLAEILAERLEQPEQSTDVMKKVAVADPAHPRALRVLADAYENSEDWSALVTLYTGALKARRRTGSRESEIGMLLQIAMLYWKRLDDLDASEEYFRRIRKLDPAHPAALAFYRTYYPPRGEGAKLLQVLRQAQKSLPSADDETAIRKRAIAVEIAELAEYELGNPEKAIDAWKSILRAEPGAEDARAALKRLYRKTEKWNALLDIMKDEVERLPKDAVDGRVAGLMEVVAIYRDRLKLDVMVINTYNSILKLDPENRQALDDLAAKYEGLGRWNDLIAILSRKAQLSDLPVAERAGILRRIAGLWAERFGNYAQAIKPLEQLIEIAPDDAEALTQLKEIYTRRRQWRALIGLLDREAEKLSEEECRDVLAEMARLATERLGDNHLAIQLWNRVLPYGSAGGESNCDGEALDALSRLYEREKRYPALAEIYRRQRLIARDENTVVGVLERLGGLLNDRLKAPGQAAEAFREILAIRPRHGRATRTLRELYRASRDYRALEDMYSQLGQWDELVEALQAMADRIGDPDEKIALLERTAAIAAEYFDKPDRVARAYERILSIEPMHLGAARALVPIYEKTQKWARLLSTYEILLEHASGVAERLDLHLKSRDLCETRLGSKALAFQWTAKAFELAPDSEDLLRELERLGGEADEWNRVAEILDRRAGDEATGETEKLRFLRELGKITAGKLHDPERARGYQKRVLQLAPDDSEAMSALEEIATQLSEWPDLLEVYRRRVELSESNNDKIEILFKIAFIEEERLAELDATARTYQAILDLDSNSQRAMRALGKIQEARGDWEGLAEVLSRDLDHTEDIEVKVELLLRIGGLRENSLDRADDALNAYCDALALDPGDERIHRALQRFLDSEGADGQSVADRIPASRRVEVAALLLPIFEEAGDARRIARAIEVLRTAADTRLALDYDRRLSELYGTSLGDARQAYQAGLRVLAADPFDVGMRAALLDYAQALGANEDLAEHLVKILESSATEGDQPARQALAAELARLYEERLDAPDKAEKAWLAVLDLPETEDEYETTAYDSLARIYRATARFTDLRDLLLRREKTILDGDARKEIILAICELEESVLDNPDGAIAAYQSVLDIDPGHSQAYRALERLLLHKESYAELERLLGRQLDQIKDEDERIALIYRRAELRARNLSDQRGATDLLEVVVDRQPHHEGARALLEEIMAAPELRMRIARILEPLYESEERWSLFCAVLRAQREFATAPDEASDLLSRVAEVEQTYMEEPERAFETWIEAFTVDPSDDKPRRAVLQLAASLDRWPTAAAAYEDALDAVDSADVALVAELLAELAAIYDDDLTDVDKAISAYVRLYELDPSNPDTVRPAIEALARLYQEQQRWGDLISALRRQSEWVDNPEERKELLAKVAFIEEEKLEDTAAAAATWREVLAEDPEDARSLDALERLLGQQGNSAELGEILRRRVEFAGSPEERKQFMFRIARLCERDLEDTQEAIAAYLEVLDELPDDRATLIELSRLYAARERYPDLLDILERRLFALRDRDGGEEVNPGAEQATGEDAAIEHSSQAAEAHSDEAAELMFEIGKILETRLARDSEAVERYAAVLEIRPDHGGALSAVEALLAEPELRRRVAEILQPIYEAGQEHQKLANLLLQVADSESDARDQLPYLREVADLFENYLDDKNRSFEVMIRTVRAAVAEPELPFFINELARLAAELGREGDLIDIYAEIAPDVFDGELQRRLYLDVADLARAVRKDIELGREFYRRVLDSQPDDRRALSALESIYRVTAQYADLYEILIRKAELAGDDFDAQAAGLAEAAGLCADELGRPDDAIVAWEQVLEITPENREAVQSLEKLYEDSDRYHDLVDLLERRLGYAFALEEAVSLRYRLGQIHEEKLNDSDNAVENYSAALGGDPDHEGAIEALERFLDDPGLRNPAADVLEASYVKQQDWIKLVRIYEIKLDAAENTSERVALTRYIASLYEEQLEDLKQASHWYGRVFREVPQDAAVRDQLWRLATILDNWAELANVYQAYLDEEDSDGPEVVEVARTLGHIYNDRLEEIERGQAAYRRVLEILPDDLATFDRLESMLIRGERWYAIIDVYEEAIEASNDDERRQGLYMRMAQVYENNLHDPAQATDAYRAVLDIDTGNTQAAEDLERLYEQENQWYELAELLAMRIDRVVDQEGAEDAESGSGVAAPDTESAENLSEYRMRLADVLETRLGDLAAAIDQYELVLSSNVDWQRALAPLERLVVNEDHRERIAELLEPVYRRKDWWQKLVVILDAQVAYANDPARRVSLLCEVARLHETRGGDPNLALDALSRAWMENVHDVEVYDELTALAAKLGAWDQLVDTLAQGIKDEYDADLVASVRARIAEIHEHQRRDVDAAIAAWREVLEVLDDDPRALAALDRLLASEGHFAELVVVLQRRADLSDDEGNRLLLLHRIATLDEEELDQPDQAITAYKNVLAVDDANREALDALERLYRSQSDWNDLVDIYSRKIDLADNRDARRELRFAAAAVYDGELNDSYEAIALYNAALSDDPDDGEALAKLDELYAREAMWPELLEVLDRRAALENEAGKQAELNYRAALMVENELLEAESAIDRYAVVLELNPDHTGARRALDRLAANQDTLEAATGVLERIYRSERDFDKLAELYERTLDALGPEEVDPAVRKNQYDALAEVYELAHQDPEAAFAVWARALVEQPEDEDIQAQLERLASERGAWEELVELLEERLVDIVDAQLEYVYAAKLARLYEDALGDLDRAAHKYRQALEVAGDERESLAALDRIYSRAGKSNDLAEILAMEAEATSDEVEQCEFLFRLGDLREMSIGDTAGAVSAYSEVLERMPQHTAARGALERLLLSAESERPAIISILEPLYENEDDYSRLADLLTAKLSITDDHIDRAQIYERVAELSENHLGDPVRALDATGGWLAEDPQSEEALNQLERLAEVVQRWGEVAARLEGIIQSADSEDVKRALFGKLGTIQLERLGDAQAAEATFRALLAVEPESTEALEALAQIYRLYRDSGALADVMWQLGELTYDGHAKRDYFVEVGLLREDLGDLDGAIAAWTEVLSLDESDRHGLERLAAIYERRERWEEFIEVLEQTARYAADADEERALRTRIAGVYSDVLGQLDDAVDAWQAVLDAAPDDARALEALERVHVQREDWSAVHEVLLRRLEVLSLSGASLGDIIAVHYELSELAETRLEAMDEAVAHLYQVLDIDNAHYETYERLERLLARAEHWHDLVEVLERLAEVHGAMGDIPAEVAALARAADVWEEKLDDPDAAGSVLEKILHRDSGYVPALTRLAKIYEDAGDWERCGDVLERALAMGPQGRDAAELQFRMGEVVRRRDSDVEQATQYWGQALHADGSYLPAIEAMERAAREGENWEMVVNMMIRRESLATDNSERLEISLELAHLYQTTLNNPAQAIPLLERVAQTAPDDPRVLNPLADLYFAVGRHNESAPIYRSLAESAKKSRKMKDLARYQQRLGGILEAQGQIDEALASYEEAFRVNPTDVATMAGLGRIYLQREAWQKARRVYRSLVLQNIDPSMGLTKAEVYYHLGTIHVKLGEDKKAKGMFQRGLEHEPDNQALRQALSSLG
ncbi:MAG: tetratricopeptide repeat protein [Proteobacteria bacterium]|nr:tetratricopeptide repeat protein [Pseudomonadota bacterium]